MMMTTATLRVVSIIIMKRSLLLGCRDVNRRPVMLACCQQSDVWSDEGRVQQLAELLLYHCITCCTPVYR